MLSTKSMALIGILGSGAVAGGYLGWNRASRDKNLDFEDRAAFTGSSIVAGAAVAGAAAGIGTTVASRMGWIGNTVYKGSTGAYKAMTLGSGKILPSIPNIPKVARGPLAALAILAAGVGVIAYKSRSNPPTTAYASNDGMGGTQYSANTGVKDRLGLLGATGDMVFGLNNMRKV